jgi:hypothetical protein
MEVGSQQVHGPLRSPPLGLMTSAGHVRFVGLPLFSGATIMDRCEVCQVPTRLVCGDHQNVAVCERCECPACEDGVPHDDYIPPEAREIMARKDAVVFGSDDPTREE